MARGLKPRVEPAIEAALQKKGNLSDLDLAKLCFCARRSAARILFDLHRHELVYISGYTNIPWRKAAESPDGPRYKALGNSWAVPVVAWIGQRIKDQLQ